MLLKKDLQRVVQLLESASLSESDKQFLINYLNDPQSNELKISLYLDFLENAEQEQLSNPEFSERLLEKIHAEIGTERKKAPVFRFNWKWTAAAVLLGILGITAVQLLQPKPVPPIVKLEPAAPNEVPAPTISKAYITLSTGENLVIDSSKSGQLAIDANVQITKNNDGSIAYSGSSTAVTFNTLTNPRGSKPVSIILNDGTKVWLNTASSLTYPTAFTGTTREVSIIGEAYFEVSKNEAHPFKVKLGEKGTVTVLGTHFNINRYDDEQFTAVTLLEGSVRYETSPQQSVQLSPGQQANFNNGAAISVDKNVNIEAVMAWKNGLFYFNQADLGNVMRQIARWYDMDLEFKGAIPKRRFGGEMQRDLKLNEVLKLLETNKVKFKIEGKQITVFP